MLATTDHKSISPQQESWLKEFEESAISPELARANVRWIEGESAPAEFLEGTITQRQRNTSYITAGNARLLRRYAHITDGGWITYGIDIDSNPGEVPYLKPANPRQDSDGKVIKYETPPSQQARPLLPDLESAWDTIVTRYRIQQLPGETPWQAVLRTGIDVAFIEGFKKALALVQQGVPAIAIRGITQWHQKGSKELWPELAQFCDGRTIHIGFDQDEKVKTRSDVARQGQQLGDAIQKLGSDPKYLFWDGREGKGIDDAIAAQSPEQRSTWLTRAMKQALTQKEWKRVASKRKAQAILARRPLEADRATKGEYIPELPPISTGAINALSATMNSGKTYRIGKDWVKPWIEAGGIVVVLSPLNSLGRQTAGDFGLPHIHDYGTDANSQFALRADISYRGGIVACVNSAHRILKLIPQDRPLLLVIDEAAQTLTDAAEGETLKDKWSERWEDLITLKQRAIGYGAIALAEDGLGQATISLVQALSGAPRTLVITHEKEADPWLVNLYRATSPSEYRSHLRLALRAGKRVLYVTTSREEGRRVEDMAKQEGIPYVRIDSTTNEKGRFDGFYEKPNQYLQENQPQLVILSPSGKTGVSIEGGVSAENAYFESVWGYFPGLDGDTQKQLLGRYRPPVPRYIWAPAYIQPDPGEKSSCNLIKRESDLEVSRYEVSRYETAAGFTASPPDSHDKAIKIYLAKRRQRRWAQKITAADSLARELELSGHQIHRVESAGPDQEVQKLWNEIKEKLARDDSNFHAALHIDPEVNTMAWAYKATQEEGATYETRCKAHKVRMIHRFPGMGWDDPELWYAAEFCPRHSDKADGSPSQGPLAPGASLWAEADHKMELWQEDAKTAYKMLEKRLKATHMLPTAGAKAAIASLFKPLLEKLLALGKVVPGDPLTENVKEIGLRYAADIRRYWRLNIQDNQSAVEITNKILRKFGLTLIRTQKVTTANRGRQWAHKVEATDFWWRLVQARQRALGSGTDSLIATFNKFVPLETVETLQFTSTSSQYEKKSNIHLPSTELQTPI